MRPFTIYLLLPIFLLIACKQTTNDADKNVVEKAQPQKLEYALALHGGAGVITKKNMTPEKEAIVRKALMEALEIGEEQLKNGEDAENVVVKVITYLENRPEFNAGKGAVLTYEKENELDASIMRGKDLNAGAVSGVKTVKNPIQLAQAVMNKSKHVMLSGKGAVEFAEEQNIQMVDPSYFLTDRRIKSWEKARAKAEAKQKVPKDSKMGTVGCVVLDQKGNLAAGTSTGGMTLKRYGRIGDSPVIGAGTYADNASCAISATGHGEYFIRHAVAHDISARMLYGGISLKESSNQVINDVLVKAKGAGGIIAVDKYGNIAMPFNTKGMYRGYLTPTQKEIGIFKNEGEVFVEVK